MASNVPSSRHLANRAYTDCQGPYASGISRHCAPLRTIQSIPLSMFRSSFRGRPRFPALSGGNSSCIRSHCPFVNSYRFISLFLHEHLFCAIFIFQTPPKGFQLFSYDILAYAVSAGMKPVIPPKKNRKEQRDYDKYLYISSHTPAFVQARNRLYTLCHGPNRSGRSLHGIPVFSQYRIALSISRLLFPGRPPCGFFSGGNLSLIRFHCFSLISCLFMCFILPSQHFTHNI